MTVAPSFALPARPHRRARLLPLLLALLLLPLIVASARAATYRSHIARVPSTPSSSDTVRIWMNSDTASGEMAGVEYQIGGSYIKVLGSYDNTSYPGANWYADISAQPNGTVVEYQLFTRNQTATDYGFTGFNWSYTVGGVSLSGQRALWLDQETVAWNGATGSSYRLLFDPDGGLSLAAAEAMPCPAVPTAPCFLTLTASGTIDGASYPKNPNAGGLVRLTFAPSAEQAKALLTGQLAVAAYDAGGSALALSGVQLQSVLDDLYVDNGTAAGAALGPSYSGGAPTLRLWAPTAQSVTLRRFADATTASFSPHAMTLDAASGVWTVTGDASWDRQFYLFDVQVYVPSTDAVEHNLVSDPYAVNLSADGVAAGDVRSQLVNLDDGDLMPSGWNSLSKPALAAPEDIAVYEVHVRDFSRDDATVPAAQRGTFAAFTDTGSDGMQHLLALQQAGLTHVHLMPAFDIASVIEPSAERTEPSFPVADMGRASDDQQAEVGADRATDSFNWGYDPYHYGAPEGSYSTDPASTARILEFRQMVQVLNQSGLRVVMDVVYNHTAASGQDDKSVLDRIVPGYYYRYGLDGTPANSSCCADTASEYAMMEKLMVDTMVRWADDYKVDGFRFDLMNLHTVQNAVNAKNAVQAIDPSIYVYGEGWNFGSAAAKGVNYAQQSSMAGTGIGTFNDRLRDAAHGGYNSDSTTIRHQGFINGLSYDWNGYCYSNRFQSDLHSETARLRVALQGSVSDYTDDPQETVNYVSKHDNETLFDQNAFKMPSGDGTGLSGWCGSSIPFTPMAARVRAQNLGISLVGLAQGVPFFHMGSDLLRSKSLDRNSYDSGDWFNRVHWDGTSNNFGVGLPPAWDNSTRWPIMAPLLANAALDPAPSDIAAVESHMRETLRLRASSPLFRLRSEADALARVAFLNTDNSHDALIVMMLSDLPAPDLDASWEYIVVLINANTMAQSYTVASLAGNPTVQLHPILADGIDADPVVQGSSFDSGSGTFTIPARTTALFVATEAPAAAPTSIEWVGRMFPRGGVANRVDEGAATGNFDVYVQVYDDSNTPAAGAPADISCALHWGEYGTAWSDIPMTWNVQIGNNDEFRATIPQATLDALPAGSYGFTAYCQKAGESNRWKVDSYDLDSNALDDDQGDGLITVVPAADSSPEAAGGVFVHLFEWRWADVQQECPYLAEKGYTGVQLSPPNEHLVPTADQGGQAASDFPWWARYQPVSHDPSTFASRSGSWADFQSMVSACNAVGVDIIVDAVINHMADIEVGTPPTGSAGSEYDSDAASRFYGSQYAAADFHADCTISDYADRVQVQRCQLSGLPDLDTGRAATQTTLRAYLQALLDAGVAGFRIDGAKHIAAHELDALLAGLSGDFYLFQEVIDQSTSERVRDWEYTPTGDVTEFAYAFALGEAFDDSCAGTLSALEGRFDDGDMLPSRFAQIFTDNHDNQRGHGVGTGCIVDHRDGQEHALANIFALAYPYGHPSVMSSYYWQSSPTDNTGDSLGPPTVNGGPGSDGATLPVYLDGDSEPDNCAATFALGKWACEHRRTATANMVQFRQVTAGQPVSDWQTINADHIAFGRGALGFVAINNSATAGAAPLAPVSYQTGMAAGTYCDVTRYDAVGGASSRTCVDPVTGAPAPDADKIVVAADGTISREVPAATAFAIHRDSLLPAPTAVTLAAFEAEATGDGIRILWETVAEQEVLGFNLLRGEQPNGAATPVNAELIAAQGAGSGEGGIYSWLDPLVAQGATYYYWLEAVAPDGSRTRHGPISATALVPTAVVIGALSTRGNAATPLLALLPLAGLALALAWQRRR